MPAPQKFRFQLRVQPNAKKQGIEKLPNGDWKLKISAKPVDGAANEAVIEFLAEHFKVPKRAVTIIQGLKSRIKLVEIETAVAPRA